MAIDKDTLLQEASCLICGGVSYADALIIALLQRIAEGRCGPVPTCEMLSGEGSPVGARTPNFIGQLYHDTAADDYWRSTGLTNTDWTQIVTAPGEPDGLIWGPSPETVDDINGTNDNIFTALDTFIVPTGTYTTLSFGNPTTVNNNVDFNGSTLLTELEMRLLETVGGLIDVGGTSLTSTSFPALISVGTDLLFSVATITSINFNSLEAVGGNVDLSGTALTSVTLPSLQTSDEIDISGGSIETLNLPVMAAYPPSGITSGASLLTLNIPACVDDAASSLQADLTAMTGLVTLNLNALVTPNAAFNLTASPDLANVNLSAMIAPDATDFNFNGCSLTETSVDHILARLVANPAYLTGNVDLSGGTNAPPSAQGAADVLTLQGRGVTVTTN